MKTFLALLVLLTASVEASTILFLGDSLTEGYQLSKEESFPSVIERKLSKTHKDLKVINGGVAGATSASGPKRMEWYKKTKIDVMVLALGANDGLRGMKVTETEKNLSAVIEKAQARGIKVVLAGMKMPTNMGEPYRTDFEKIFPKIAEKYKVRLIPFLLEGVGGNPKLNLPDGIHPNAKGYEVIANTVMKELEPEL